MMAVTLNGMLLKGRERRWYFLGWSLHAVREKVAKLMEGK